MKERYVVGHVCSCGRIFPSRDPFLGFPAPSICPKCGTILEEMKKQGIIETRWKTGRFFKTENIKYRLPKEQNYSKLTRKENLDEAAKET